MIDKKWGYLNKVKLKQYERFTNKFKLNDNEKIIFDNNKFNKIEKFPDIIYKNIEDEFLEKNKFKFLKFSSFQKDMINEGIYRIESEIEDEKEGLYGLELREEKIKKYICPMCGEGKRSTRKYCSMCWSKIRRSRRNSVWNSDYREDIYEPAPIRINTQRTIFRIPLETRMPKINQPRIRMPKINPPKIRASSNPFALKRNPKRPIVLKRKPKIGW